ncbi:MAG: nitrate reductase molybdenum cofactor assembly chaperone [Fidelibacterota bacterium]
MNSSIYTDLVPLISYPETDMSINLEKIEISAGDHDISEFQIFSDYVRETVLSKLQEDFTHTFDLNPTTCLDLGWHLHGENYERGMFMVRVREMLRGFEIPETSELPDHLTHILSMLPHLDEENRKVFIKSYVIPATEKIIEGFGDTENPYKHLMQFINDVLLHHTYDEEVQA